MSNFKKLYILVLRQREGVAMLGLGFGQAMVRVRVSGRVCTLYLEHVKPNDVTRIPYMGLLPKNQNWKLSAIKLILHQQSIE